MTLRIGEASVERVEEMYLPVPFTLLTEDEDFIARRVAPLPAGFLDRTKMTFQFSCHSWVIRVDGRTVLVDPCNGNGRKRGIPHFDDQDHPYLERLAAAGTPADTVDIVFCTHLHSDHCGWNTMLVDGHWAPTFPNARYLFVRREWEHWREAELRAAYTTDPYYEDSLLPVMDSGQAELVATDYAFDDSVWIEPWPGHTPGHVCVVVRSQRASVVLSGDIMHTALQCAEPQLNSCFCVDAETARATRRRFLETFVDSPIMIIPAHFPTPTAGWIRSHDRSFRFHFDRLR